MFGWWKDAGVVSRSVEKEEEKMVVGERGGGERVRRISSSSR